MKKHISIAIASAVLLILTVSCKDRDMVVKPQVLPQSIQSFLYTHFTNLEPAYVLKDGKEFEVRFVNGWNVDFDRNGEWESIDCNMDAVPSSLLALVPESIHDYLKGQSFSAFVVEISRDRSGYDIKLSNGLEIEFSSNGDFKRIDD